MTDDEALIDPLKNLPRYVIFRSRKARLIGYDKKLGFEIIDSEDARRFVKRHQIIFTKPKRTSSDS